MSNSPLIYFLSETHFFSKDDSLLVVNLVGSLTKKNIPVFQQCQDQISRSRARWIVVNFRDVPMGVDNEYMAVFDLFRAMIYKKPAQLRMSGLHPSLKQMFLEKKILEPTEITNNLAEALQSFPKTQAA